MDEGHSEVKCLGTCLLGPQSLHHALSFPPKPKLKAKLLSESF